jgi:hypothetical protein
MDYPPSADDLQGGQLIKKHSETSLVFPFLYTGWITRLRRMIRRGDSSPKNTAKLRFAVFFIS